MPKRSDPRRAAASPPTLFNESSSKASSSKEWSQAVQPSPGDSPPQPTDEELLFRYFNEIGIIHQLASNAFQRVLPHGLTGAQFTVLNHCMRMGDNKTPAQLADILQVTRATLTSTLARLEAKGFIRLVPDEVDGRSKRVLLTASGRRARDESIKASWPLLGKVKTALTRAETEQQLPRLVALRDWLDQNRKL